jgi:hypothetical protein
VDVRGDGSELLVCADAALRGWSDPSRERVLATASARYRSTFGTEQWKTYFDAGLWVPVRSRLAAGPLVGLGLIHDFSQDWGAFVGGEFGAAWGEARIASFSLAAGLQLRFALP